MSFNYISFCSFFFILNQASIIAFTSEFIPKLVYRYSYSPSDNLDGYVDWTLSYFNVSDFEDSSKPSDNKSELFGTVTICRYFTLSF